MKNLLNPTRKARPRRRLLNCVIAACILALLGGVWYRWNQRAPVAATEIDQGVIYGCDQLAPNEAGHGLVHWVKVDLTAPGIELYVTPLDPVAQTQAWQYRLETTSSVVKRERLAVGVNACLFTSDSGWIPLSGDLARTIDTVVANHQVSHIGQHSYLLWFSDDLTPQQETSKPPLMSTLHDAQWGVSGQGVGLIDGEMRLSAVEDRGPDARTAIGVDRARKLLFVAVFERATPLRAYEKLAELGAKEGMLLDGGHSSSMILGRGARGVRAGTLTGNWLPVATHFGVRAKPFDGGLKLGRSNTFR